MIHGEVIVCFLPFLALLVLTVRSLVDFLGPEDEDTEKDRLRITSLM